MPNSYNYLVVGTNNNNNNNNYDYYYYYYYYYYYLVRSSNRTHRIRKVPVRLCSITEPMQQQSNRLRSIDSWFGLKGR